MGTVLNERELETVNGGRKYEDYEAQEDIKLWPFGRDPLDSVSEKNALK